MSVDIDWQTLTGGPDGERLAESIRDFVHERFQHIPLPKLIRSVTCHGFEFGSIAPQIVLKDICDPLPDFYEDADETEVTPQDERPETDPEKVTELVNARTVPRRGATFDSNTDPLDSAKSSTLSRGTTPGILGATSNLGYFHLPLSAGLSGTNTPLAAVAGARFQHVQESATSDAGQHHHHSESFSSISPPPSAAPSLRPASRDSGDHRYSSAVSDGSGDATQVNAEYPEHDASPEDLQIVFHVNYDGDVRLLLTAEVFLDYPMPSFVGIPLKLTITGLTFDGVGILAYIKRRAHLCFLAPDDAEALVGGDVGGDAENENENASHPFKRVGALLEDIRIESEMGESDNGKQVLKNVGKIERFVLEQVQRIFEDEFVYPSFWTFLV